MVLHRPRVAGRFYFWSLIMAVAVLAAMSIATGAHAQVVPSVLEEVRLVDQDDDSATFLLRFSPAEPRIADINNNPTTPEVVMATTLKTGRVRARETYRGFVRSVTFVTEGSSLVMRLDTAGPASVRSEGMGANAVQVRVARAGREEALGSRPLGSEGEEVVPQQELNRGPVDAWQPGDSYELVMLKYADVSEVIGLLVEGVEIQPNDVFIREAPGFGSVGTNQNTSYIGAPQQAQREELPLGQNFGNGLAVDRRLNAIWITGSPDRIERVKRQIELIDVPVDSVILETQFVELTETGARNLGLDFTN